MPTHDADLMRWHRELHDILNAVSDTTRAVGAVSARINRVASVYAEAQGSDGLARIGHQVQAANALAQQLLATDPGLAVVVLPLLSVPGERSEFDLRPWWVRLLGFLSVSARRNESLERLETLRLEADAALMRAATRLGRPA